MSGDSTGRGPLSAMITMYGGAPAPLPGDEIVQRFRETTGTWIDTAGPATMLVPCATCKRHIAAGTECPFCYAELMGSAPGRAELEVVKKKLRVAVGMLRDIQKVVSGLQATLDQLEEDTK